MADILLEMGRAGNGSIMGQYTSRIRDIFDTVAEFENPAAGFVEGDDPLSPKEQAIVDKIIQISRQERSRLIQQALHGIYDLGGVQRSFVTMGDLRGELLDIYELGKKKRKGLFKKIGKAVFNPKVLKIVGIAAIAVGAGVLVGAALAKAAKAAEAKAAAAKAKKDAKAAEKAEADAIAAQEAAAAAAGTGLADPNAAGASADALETMGQQDPALAKQAGAGAGGMANDMASAGTGNTIGTSLKGAGQTAAAVKLANKLGIPVPQATQDSVNAFLSSNDPRVAAALAAGEQDLLNNAAVSGETDAINRALGLGGGIPLTPILIGAGIVLVVGGVLFSRRA